MKPRITGALLPLLALWTPYVAAEDMLTSTSLKACQQNNQFSASLFDVAFTPGNSTLSFNIVGTSTVKGYVNIELAVYAYGYKAYTKYINPCDEHYDGLCPMQIAPVVVNSNAQIDPESLAKIPGMRSM